MSYTFPNGFLWGTGTAAHQVEGNNTNSDFWVMEHLPGTIFVEPSGDAIDHYHRYAEDIKLLAELGFNSYRFSIEWARVEPEEGYFSQTELDHYSRMLEACHAHGMQPVLTYHHFTSPRWLISKGGWKNPDTAGRFADYCERVTKDLGDQIALACTINEANIPAMFRTLFWGQQELDEGQAAFANASAAALGTTRERLAPFLFTGTDDANAVILSAHRQAGAAIRATRSNLPVGMTLALQDMQAADGGTEIRDQMRQTIQDTFLAAAADDDFLGVQTYSRIRIGPEGPLGPEDGVELTQMGYEFWPEALEATIRYAVNATGLPIYVTENGIGTDDDARRQAYYRRALRSVAACLEDKMDIRCYFCWSAFDNFEWMMGYQPKFGLIAVDRENQRRSVKETARWLGQIAQTNSLEL